MSTFKAPPRKSEDITYANWKKEIDIWSFQSSLDADKKGSALFLSLEGKARQTVLAELETTAINHADGIKNILTVLDKFYKKDSTNAAGAAFNDFIDYKRDKDVSLEDFLIEFNLKYHRMENSDMKLPTGVLAGFLLRCCNLDAKKEEVCRAACPNWTYDDMKETIENVGVSCPSSTNFKEENALIKFSATDRSIPSSSQIPDLSKLQIKQEPAFVAEADVDSCSEEEVLYGYNRNFNQRANNSRRQYYGNQGSKDNVKKNFRQSQFNPPDPSTPGLSKVCEYCRSVCHLVAKCPDCPEHLRRRLMSKNLAFVAFDEESQYL